MSVILGYGQTSSVDTTGLSNPISGDPTSIKGKQGLLLQAVEYVLPSNTLQASNITPVVGYTGLSFMKNVYSFCRDYWDKTLGTPYGGQIYPTGESTRS